MVTDEEMKLRSVLEPLLQGDKKAYIDNVLPRMQGTNFESYPERYIPPHVKVIRYMQSPDFLKILPQLQTGLDDKDKKWLNELITDKHTGGWVNPREKADVNIRQHPKGQFPFPPESATAHELEHTSQQGMFNRRYSPTGNPQLQALTDELYKKTGTAMGNSNEILAELSAVEAVSPVGTGLEEMWKRYPDMEQWATRNRRRDIPPLRPLPRPDVKIYPNKPTSNFLEQIWNMMKR